MSFESLELDPILLQAVEELGFTRPTTIQTQVIPVAMEGRDVMASAPTGTGKTVTLQRMAEQFSRIGIPVFLADVKGDLSGIGMSRRRFTMDLVWRRLRPRSGSRIRCGTPTLIQAPP